MGSCASVNNVGQKQDVVMRKIKLTNQQLKQREEQRKQKRIGDRQYVGEEQNAIIDIQQYEKQSHLVEQLPVMQWRIWGTSAQEKRLMCVFQPMLKRLVLGHQEQFPRWLINDEQFRNDQMRKFLQKCQETAKSHDLGEDNEEEEEEADDDDDAGKVENRSKGGNHKLIKMNTENVFEQAEEYEDDDEEGGEESVNEEHAYLLQGKRNRKQGRDKREKSIKPSRRSSKQPTLNSHTIVGDKTPCSKMQDSGSENSSFGEDDRDDQDEQPESRKDMNKLQDITGVLRNEKEDADQMLKGGVQARSSKTYVNVPSLRIINQGTEDNEGPSSSQRGVRSHNQSKNEQPGIIKNDWLNEAICFAEIKSLNSILEFKRRYFYEFDKMSAFLSQLLALKRMNFPNLLTFSFLQIGEVSYQGEFNKKDQLHQANPLVSPTSKMQRQSGMASPIRFGGHNKNTGMNSPAGPNRNTQKKSDTLQVHREESQDGESGDEEDDSRLVMYVDIILPFCGKSLEEYIVQVGYIDDIFRACIKGFEVFDAIAYTLCKMHRAGFSYGLLHPSMVRINLLQGSLNVYLESPGYVWQDTERKYIQKYVSTDADFMAYDCKCLTSLMIYYFLSTQEIRTKRAETHNLPAAYNMRAGQESTPRSLININNHLTSLRNISTNNNPLKSPTHASAVCSIGLIPATPTFAELVTIETPTELEAILAKLKLPQVAKETIESLAIAQLELQKPIEEFNLKIKGVLEKGPQTAFKHDSLSAYLSFHGTRSLNNDNMHVYFHRKNQVHFYEFESKTFKVIKLIRKKAKFPILTHLTFSPYDNCFYFFASPNSNKIVKIPLNTNSKERHVINQKAEVIFFKSIKNMPVEEPQILTIIPDDFSFSLYVFNSRKNTDNDTNDVYYNSYIVNIVYKANALNSQDWKETIQIYEGPRNYLWRRRSFHFYDPHNKFIYSILDSVNIFERGIRFSYFDTSIQKGDFKEGNLRFACSTEDVIHSISNILLVKEKGREGVQIIINIDQIQKYKLQIIIVILNGRNYKNILLAQERFCMHYIQLQQLNINKVYAEFCELRMNIEQPEFCTEVQHGVFLLQASKNIYVLDFNYKCFYSFSTLTQLKNYERNNKMHPRKYQNVYEVLNQPFEVKFNTALNLGKNVVFQDGMLHMFGRKEIETVICTYQLFPTQGVMALKKCVSLHSFDDILLKIPKQMTEIWNFQEYKRIVYQKTSEGEGKSLNLSINNQTSNQVQRGPSSQSSQFVQQQQSSFLQQKTQSQTQQGQVFPLIRINTLAIEKGTTIAKLKSSNPLMKSSDEGKLTLNSNQMAGQETHFAKQLLNTGEVKGPNKQKQSASEKKDDQLNQDFKQRIKQINLFRSSLTEGQQGILEPNNEFQESEYKLLGILQQTSGFTLYRVLYQQIAWNIRRMPIKDISEYEEYVQMLELNAQSKYLMQIKQCFLSQDDTTGELSVNIIEEDAEWSLLDEMKKRCEEQNFFKNQEIGYFIKAIFKAIISLQRIQLIHGNIHPRIVYFTSKGFTRIAGWYLDNPRDFQNDFIDACTLVYQMVTLEFDELLPFKLTPQYLQTNQGKFKNYPGVFQFLLNNLLILYDGENLDLQQISEDVKDVYQTLQTNPIRIGKEDLSSSNQRVFWIGYGSNYIISSHYEEASFCKNELIFHNNTSYKFSKYNMFTFDRERTMYMSGSLKYPIYSIM